MRYVQHALLELSGVVSISSQEYAMTSGPFVSPFRDPPSLTAFYIRISFISLVTVHIGHVCLERSCTCANSLGEEADDGEQERLLQNTIPDPQPPMVKGVEAGD